MRYRIITAATIMLVSMLTFLIIPISNYLKARTDLQGKNFDFNFWSDIWVSFFSALLFTLFIFFINELVLKEHDVSGVWVMETNLLLSSTISGYQIGYRIYLLKKGSEITGEGEKIYEIDQEDKINEFIPATNSKIFTIQIEGYLGKRYLKSNIIRLLVREEGAKRNSLMVLDLKFRNEKELVGTFATSAASSYGNVTLKKVLL